MPNYDIKTKVIISDYSTSDCSTEGSCAKDINDYIETINKTKDIISISQSMTSEGKLMTVIIHDS
jgi:hypothetical protein